MPSSKFSILASIIASITTTLIILSNASIVTVTSFVIHNPTHTNSISAPTTTGLNMFGDAFKNAFSNDESLGKRENAGLKGGPNFSECTINGKSVKAVANQKVSQVAAAARTKITYSCKKGDCGTCEIMMNGRVVKACQAKIPAGKCSINTF